MSMNIAPWGYRKDGTPKAKPGRKATLTDAERRARKREADRKYNATRKINLPKQRPGTVIKMDDGIELRRTTRSTLIYKDGQRISKDQYLKQLENKVIKIHKDAEDRSVGEILDRKYKAREKAIKRQDRRPLGNHRVDTDSKIYSDTKIEYNNRLRAQKEVLKSFYRTDMTTYTPEQKVMLDNLIDSMTAVTYEQTSLIWMAYDEQEAHKDKEAMQGPRVAKPATKERLKTALEGYFGNDYVAIHLPFM